LFRYLLYAAIVALIVTRPQLRQVLSDLDPRRRRYLKGIFALLLLGQCIGLKYQTYPFVKWAMYDDAGSSVDYIEYVGLRAGGGEAPFPVAQLVRTHSTARAIECPTCGKRLLWRLRGMTEDLEELPPGRHWDERWLLLERTLRAAWGGYKQRHPEADFRSVRLYRVRTSVPDFRAGLPPERSLLFEVELEPEGGAS
jgi:hypothetical protein